MHKLKRGIFFGSIIRTLLEVFIDVFFASLYNTVTMTWNNSMNIYSNVVGFCWIVIFTLFIIVICIAIIKFPSEYDEKVVESHKFGTLAEDLKESKKICMVDTLIFLLRRIIISFIIIFGWNHGFIQVIWF